MTDRALVPLERALVAAAVAFCVQHATGFYEQDKRLLQRLADITDAIKALSLADQLVINTGPVQYIYGDTVDLIEVSRDKGAPARAVSNHKRYLACHVFQYFELRSVLALRAVGLPDRVPDPEEAVTVF